jgi:hypothetical protein
MVPVGTEATTNSDHAGQVHPPADRAGHPHSNAERAIQAHSFADAMTAESLEERLHSGLAFDSGKNKTTPRRTPRVSLIVVLPENHVVSPDRLAERLRAHGNTDIDVVVACAGQPTNLSALQKSVGNAQFLLAPAGTSTEDLRELAMRQVPGDIVTLLGGALLHSAGAEAPIEMTS